MLEINRRAKEKLDAQREEREQAEAARQARLDKVEAALLAKAKLGMKGEVFDEYRWDVPAVNEILVDRFLAERTLARNDLMAILGEPHGLDVGGMERVVADIVRESLRKISHIYPQPTSLSEEHIHVPTRYDYKSRRDVPIFDVDGRLPIHDILADMAEQLKTK
ncbi:hypothetical protein FWD20_00615 [Candidatus Saccharibacteria bacterium]|nr:hypothetical protein [Candidatus Saccharibacteria bacterium]